MISHLIIMAADTVNPGDSATNNEVSITTVLYLMVSLFGVSLGSPFLATFIQNRQLQRERDKEAKAIEAKLESSNAAIEQKLEDHNGVVGTQLTQIHKLVNGNLLRVMRGERDAVAQALSAIDGAIDTKRDLGLGVLPETQAARAQLEARLAVLDQVLRND